MVEKEIELIIKRFILELKNEGIKIIKIFLFGSYAMGTFKDDSDIDIAVIYQDSGTDSIDQSIKLWKIAVRVDTRIAPTSLSIAEFEKDYIPIVPEIKKGLDITDFAA